MPCSLAPQAARRPIGPAPVTSTVSASQKERRPTIDDLLERLRDHGHRLEEHAEDPERRVHLDRVLGLDAPALRHEPVDLLDPALGVLAVAAHVPLADRAVGAGHGVGRRTMPTTRSPFLSPPLGPGSTTRPSDSWPSTSRVLPGGAQPYLPSAISTSVPQTPTATASTRTEPSRTSGSGTSSNRAVPGLPGSTVIAFTTSPPGTPPPRAGWSGRIGPGRSVPSARTSRATSGRTGRRG